MNAQSKQRKRGSVIFLIAVFAVLLLAAFALSFLSSIHAGPGNGGLRVTLGNAESDAYNDTRRQFLQELAAETPGEVYAAVVCFNDYYGQNEVDRLLRDHQVQLESIYMWTPGETGVRMLGAARDDFSTGLKRAYADGERAYALCVSGSARELSSLAGETDMVTLVDLEYSPAAEALADWFHVKSIYVMRPTKPDGAV